VANRSESKEDEVSKTKLIYEDTAQNGPNILSDFLDQNMSLANDYGIISRGVQDRTVS